MSYFEKHVELLRKKNLYPAIYNITGPSFNPEIEIEGKKYITFSSNNYLGLAGHNDVKQAVKASIDIHGIGSGSTRLLSGTLDVQVEFERALSSFFGREGSLTFSSGYMANIGVIRMLVDRFPYYQFFKPEEGLILSDELNHASIIDGVRLARADRIIFKHSDMEDLEMHLSKNKSLRKLIVTDGVFSMDGEFAKLDSIVRLAKEYNALVMVDDSHAVGVLGAHGEGLPHQLGLGDKVDVIMGSFTKAFGSIGGFITADKSTVDYLKVTARSLIFSDPILPAIVSGLIKTLEIIKDGDELRKKVLDNSDYLKNGLRKSGFTVIGDRTPIVPLMVYSETKAINLYKLLFDAGILAPCIRMPAVLPGAERIRFSVMSSHTKQQLDVLLNVCEDAGKKLKLI